MNDLDKLIFHALTNEDNNYRKQAEATLIELHNNNPIEFFVQCAKLIEDPQKNAYTRNSAIIVIGRLAYLKVPATIFRTTTGTTGIF